MRRVKHVSARDKAWHDAEMAKGFWDIIAQCYRPWSVVEATCAEQYEDEDMSNSPTDVFSFIQMKGTDECWPWTGPYGGRASDRRPYFQAAGRRRIAYRWVYELVHGNWLEEAC